MLSTKAGKTCRKAAEMSKVRIDTDNGAVEVVMQSCVQQGNPGDVWIDGRDETRRSATSKALADLRMLAKLGITELDDADAFCWASGYDAGDPDNNAVQGLADALKVYSVEVIG